MTEPRINHQTKPALIPWWESPEAKAKNHGAPWWQGPKREPLPPPVKRRLTFIERLAGIKETDFLKD